MARPSLSLLFSLQLSLLGLGACDGQETPSPDGVSTASTPSTSSAPVTGTPSGPAGSTNSSATGVTTSGANPGGTDPASKIVPGQGDCPDASTLLAAPELPKRELFVGALNYREQPAEQPQHRVVTDQAAYDLLSQEIKQSLPAINFDKEQVIFGAILDVQTCGMTPDPVRVVSIEGTTHADFSVHHSFGGAACNQACAMIQEIAFVVAVAKTPDRAPTICTRKRVECRHQF